MKSPPRCSHCSTRRSSTAIMFIVRAARAIAAGRQRCQRVAVIRKPSRDDQLLLRMSLDAVIEDRELDRRLDGLGAAAGEEKSIEAARSPLRQPLHQALARR